MDTSWLAGMAAMGTGGLRGPVQGEPAEDAPALSREKDALRREVRQEVAGLDPDWRREADATIADHVLSSPWWRDARCVFCFVSLPSEIDTTPLLEDALSCGKRLCVPLCTGPGQMELRQIKSLGDLAPGTMGIREPRRDTPPVDPAEVFLSIVPCAACSAEGLRLGKGGGYYDRFLAGYRGIAATLSYEQLLTDDIPMGLYDLPVPLVVTERGVRLHGSPLGELS